MSILIRGMEIPKNCLRCPLAWVDDDYNSVCPFTNVIALNIGRQDDCPLVELPFAEELAEKLYKQIEKAVIEGSET